MADGGVGWALDAHNRTLITKEMERRLHDASADIVAGKLKVTDGMAK